MLDTDTRRRIDTARDIFKKACLPYRDPETLKLFLKNIDEFTCDHSERLGDAFETNYTLSKYQFAFLAYHMLAMSFVYSNIWQIKQARPADNKRSPQSIVSPRDRGAKNAFFPGQKIRIGSGGAAELDSQRFIRCFRVDTS